jgi:hypothetical protein
MPATTLAHTTYLRRSKEEALLVPSHTCTGLVCWVAVRIAHHVMRPS